jgi:hypothetical protein
MPRAIALMMLNGRLDDDVVEPYLDSLVASGYAGVCLHPRDGLTVPYGSRQFWTAIERIIDRACDRGLEIWFYDEFSYPSGADGGRIVERHPQARSRQLRFADIGPTPDRHGLIELGAGHLLAFLSIRDGQVCDVTDRCGVHRNRWLWTERQSADYLCTINVRQVPHERAVTTATVNVYEPESPVGSDEHLLAVFVDNVPGHTGEAGMPDVAQPEVTDLFLDEVYGRYASFAHDRRLSDVPIFQDEVKFPSELPWNAEIERRLRGEWGDGWRPHLAALHESGVAGWEWRRLQYWRACADALEQNWFARVADYCHAQGLRMTGHLAGEESIVGHWRCLGDPYRNLAHFDILGYDVINPPTTDDVHRSQAKGAKLVQSAAWIDGRKPVMAEVFGATGFHSDLQAERTILAWLGLHDIVLPVDHSTWLSAEGARKYDAPPVNTRFNPLNVARGDLWEWQDWFAGVLDEYRFDPEILVLLPQDSLARYRPAERARWAGEVSLLETFYHYVSAATLDTVMIPSEALADVQPAGDGFSYAGHGFTALLAPPVVSMSEETYRQLLRLAGQLSLRWMTPSGSATVKVFGADHPDGVDEPVPHAMRCDEAALVERKADFFADVFRARTQRARTTRTVIKSVRRRADGSELLALANPYPDETVVRLSGLGSTAALSQPPNGYAADIERDDDGAFVRLAGRDVVLLEIDAAGPAGKPPEVARPIGDALWRLLGPNQLRLTAGRASLTGQPAVDFAPEPISLLWALDVPYRAEGTLGKPTHSDAPLPEPLDLAVSFAVAIDEPLTGDLRVVLDGDSLPREAQMCWDGGVLRQSTEAVFDDDDTVFVVPAEALTAGPHELRIEGTVETGLDGVLECPVLVGRFLASIGEAGVRLSPVPDDPQVWAGLPWPKLGIPHGFGPVEYRFRVPTGSGRWSVQISPCVGVAEVSIDGRALPRSSWAPRTIPIPEPLGGGEHEVTVVLHGSWNNIFSDLNSVTNGLSGSITLTAS